MPSLPLGHPDAPIRRPVAPWDSFNGHLTVCSQCRAGLICEIGERLRPDTTMANPCTLTPDGQIVITGEATPVQMNTGGSMAILRGLRMPTEPSHEG